VSATLAAAGFNRNPLHEDEDGDESGDMHSSGHRSSTLMGQRPGSASILGSRAPSAFAAYNDPFATPQHGAYVTGIGAGYDMHGPGPARDGGYVPTRGGTPPPGVPPSAQGTVRSAQHQHTSSYEPLLGAAGLALGQRSPSSPPGLSPPGSPPGSPPAHVTDGYFSAYMAQGGSGGRSPPPALPARNPRRPSYSSPSPQERTFSPSSSVYSDEENDEGTAHEPEQDVPNRRLEVRNPGANVSRASSLA
jgi:hypothetical protein